MNIDWVQLGAALIGLASAFALGRYIPRKYPPLPPNPGAKRHFASSDEFKQWYLGIFPPGYWETADPTLWTTTKPKNDCDDRVEYVRLMAEKDGFITAHALALNGLYYGMEVTDTKVGHDIVLAICGNEFWTCDENAARFTKISNID